MPAARRWPEEETARLLQVRADKMAAALEARLKTAAEREAHAREAARDSQLRPDFNVSVRDGVDARVSAVLRKLAESHRLVQRSAETTSIRPSESMWT